MWLKRGIIRLQGYSRTQKRVGLAVVLLILAMLVFSGYFLFFYAKFFKVNPLAQNDVDGILSESCLKNDTIVFCDFLDDVE